MPIRRSHQDIVALHIPVHPADCVRRLQCPCDLCQDAQHLARRHGVASHPLIQRQPFHPLHSEVRMELARWGLPLPLAEEAGDAWMQQAREQLRLAAEASIPGPPPVRVWYVWRHRRHGSSPTPTFRGANETRSINASTSQNRPNVSPDERNPGGARSSDPQSPCQASVAAQKGDFRSWDETAPEPVHPEARVECDGQLMPART